ncbi:MAG: TrmH family RNA methyltransferase [Phycisphaerales bacterium]
MLIPIESPGDPRLADYANVRDRQLARRGAAAGGEGTPAGGGDTSAAPPRANSGLGVYLAEGELVVRTLIAAGRGVRSVLITPTRLEAMRDAIAGLDAEVPVYVAGPGVMDGVVGFHIHRGVLAAGERWPEPSVGELLADATRVLVLEGLSNHDNVGGLFRVAAALGGVAGEEVAEWRSGKVAESKTNINGGEAGSSCSRNPVLRTRTDSLCNKPDASARASAKRATNPEQATAPSLTLQARHAQHSAAVVMSPGTCDPLYRKAIRVSMGAALRVPFATLSPWPAGLVELRQAGFRLVALTPAADAMPIERLDAGVARSAVMLGAEGPGLSEEAMAMADVRVRIPMDSSVDSLNVVTAGAIALHRLRG